MAETRTIHDPFLRKDVQISDRLVDRLRGKYASGPHLPNGNPEFGWRQFQAPPIQHEAAARIEDLEATKANEIAALRDALSDTLNMLRAAHMQCGVHHDGNKRVIKARAVLKSATEGTK